MTPSRLSVYCLALLVMLFFYLPASCQTNRWVLSFNPFGLLEPKAAVGIGVGFTIDRHWELWSETSRLQHLFLNPESSSGVRQILQLKYFMHGLRDNFLAAEVRYKGFQYAHDESLYNATNNEYQNRQLTEYRRFWGAALQFGFRRPIDKGIGLYMEFVIGAGYRHIIDDHETGAPPGFHPYAKPGIDLEGIGIYYPGWIRLVWMLGKKL